MSSVALAKKRRANLNTNQPVPIGNSSRQDQVSGAGTVQHGQGQVQKPNGPMTLPQAFSIIDTKILKLSEELEKIKSSPTMNNTQQDGFIKAEQEASFMKELVDEYETRFEMIAEQINTLNNTVLKLHTYTMEVNQKLLEKAGIMDVQPIGLIERGTLSERSSSPKSVTVITSEQQADTEILVQNTEDDSGDNVPNVISTENI
jgi:hypothetical protein